MPPCEVGENPLSASIASYAERVNLYGKAHRLKEPRLPGVSRLDEGGETRE